MITFDKIVNKLSKSSLSIISISDIGSIIDPDFKAGNKKYLSEVYKTIYRLKATKIITQIKNGLYIHGDYSGKIVIEDIYWKIAKKIIFNETGGNYFIGGLKSLEINLKDYSLQTQLIVYTKDINKTLSIDSSYKIHFRTLAFLNTKKPYTFNTFRMAFTKTATIDSNEFIVACPELSLLDSLLVKDKDGINMYVIKKFLGKFKDVLSREVLGKLVRLKYISSINRLRSISKENEYSKLYSKCLEIIKNEGASCFLTLKK